MGQTGVVMAEHTIGFPAIGTRWQIDSDRRLPAALVARVARRVEAFDQTYSRFRTDSLVSVLSRGAGRVVFPADAAELFGLYRKLYDTTGGAVSPLVGQALEALGYDSSYSLRRSAHRPTVPAWDDVLHVDGAVVSTTSAVVLDVGAAGKGFLVDEVTELLTAGGVESFVIDASGDLNHRGAGVERIGLTDPADPTKVIGIAQLEDGALCASAVNRRSWGDGLHHIVDPVTGEPTSGVIATWVTASTCAVADGLATALFLVEPDRLRPHFDFDYVRLRPDRGADQSTSFRGGLFTG